MAPRACARVLDLQAADVRVDPALGDLEADAVLWPAVLRDPRAAA